MYKDIAGAILAGGGNSRMGAPKAFLSVKGRRIIDTILEIHKTFFDEILIVTDDESRFVTVGESIQRRQLVIVHMERGDNIRIISARLATRHERNVYEEGY